MFIIKVEVLSRKFLFCSATAIDVYVNARPVFPGIFMLDSVKMAI